MEARLYKAAFYGSSSSNCCGSKINDSTSEFNFSGGEDSDVLKVTKYQHNTILHVAAKSGNEKIANEILEAEATLALQTNKKLDTPLHIAARLGHAKVVSLLITTNPSALQMVNMAKNTALHEAVCNGHHGIVKLLVEKDPSLASLRNDAGESPLFMALDRKFHKISLLILEKCHDHEGLFFRGRNGMTAMHAAVIRLSQRHKVVHILDKLRAKLPFELILEEEVLPKVLEKCGHGILEVRDDFGWLPLHYAAELGHVEIVKLFLTTNINLAYEIDTQEGMSALHIAARKGWIGLLKTLVKECPDVCELLDNKNRTALHVAVECGKEDAVKTLLDFLDFNDFINDQDGEGHTCLHLAALHGHRAILIMLASDQRVQKSVLNNKGMTAADVIKSSIQFSTGDKRFLMSMMKREGHFKSLERRVIRETKTDHNQTADNEIQQGYDKCETKQLLKSNEPVRDIYEASSSGSTSAKEIHQEKHDTGKPESKKNSYQEHISSINLLVATIFASITFGAGMQMPGGYDSDGMANLRENVGFKIFMIADSVAFGCAAASMFIHFGVALCSKLLQVKYTYPFRCLMALTTIFITSSVLAFIAGENAVFKHDSSSGDFQVGLPVYVASLSFTIPTLYFLLRSLIVAVRRFRRVYAACLATLAVLFILYMIADGGNGIYSAFLITLTVLFVILTIAVGGNGIDTARLVALVAFAVLFVSLEIAGVGGPGIYAAGLVAFAVLFVSLKISGVGGRK